MTKTVGLFAAGSLAQALSDLAPRDGFEIETSFGPSGLLADRIEKGATWDVFASADTGHPDRLHRAGITTLPQVFCRNALALILRPDLGEEDVTALLCNPRLSIGISTPGNDPSGDYAVAALNRLNPTLSNRALRVTGAPGLPHPPAGRNAYAWVVTSGAADIMLTYRTNAIAACRDAPALRSLDLPAALQPDIAYALTTRVGAAPAAERLAETILSPTVQNGLAELGFLTHLSQTADVEGGPE